METDGKVFALGESILEGDGRYLKAGAAELLIGKDFAEKIGVTVNDDVRIITKTAGGSYENLDVVVAGLLSTPDPMVNRGQAFLPLSYVKKRLHMGDACTEIVVSFPEWADPVAETGKIKEGIESLQGSENWVTLDSRELAKDFVMISNSKSVGSKVILFLVFIETG